MWNEYLHSLMRMSKYVCIRYIPTMKWTVIPYYTAGNICENVWSKTKSFDFAKIKYCKTHMHCTIYYVA